MLVGPQRTPEQIEAWNRSQEEARQVFRNRDEALQEGAERGMALAPIRQALIVELGREPTRQEIIQRQREEYARLARGRGLPEGSTTVELADPDPNFDRLFSHSPPAAPHEDRLTESILSRLTNDLGALGFPPESISIDRSIEGSQSLTIHMPMTQLTQLTGPGHSSVIFTQRR